MIQSIRQLLLLQMNVVERRRLVIPAIVPANSPVAVVANGRNGMLGFGIEHK